MADDVILNKAASIERCLQRIEEEYAGNEQNLVGNQTKQDAIVLNLQRACETAIDLAMYVVSQRKLGVPQDSRDAFSLLQTAGILSANPAQRMQRMVGFRNVAVHEYTRLNLDVVHAIISKQLDDFRTFSATIVKTYA
ncbi:MAG: DUF86 domain-containing protein [Nitrospira sp.]|nr:MAG: DUF86 domain-containing protein [Nitrospira sp.]